MTGGSDREERTVETLIDEDNLQSLCSGCHDTKTRAEATSRALAL